MTTGEGAAQLNSPAPPYRCRVTLLCALVALHSTRLHAAEPAGPAVEFNSAFLRGGSQVDISRFSQGNQVLPGDYLVDLHVNDKWASRSSIRFVGQPGSDSAQPCIDRAIFDQIGLDTAKLSREALAGLPKSGSAECVDLEALVPDATVSFELSRLRFDISVPQVAMLNAPRGYVGPELWDKGVTSATLGYNLNAYRYEVSGSVTTRGHVDLAAGMNVGSWHLRQRSSVNVTSGQPVEFNSIATYLAHDIPSLRSDLTVGDNFTDGAVFESFGFRGLSLASNDQMLPDSRLEFAPVVRGMARTNARVVITQNGITILETTVSPGAFKIDDLYATGYGGDLSVVVHEADGSQQAFTVPYASMPQLLRPGLWRYTAAAGELRQSSAVGSQRFVQATVQRGFSSLLTGYAGATGANHYQAVLLGVAVNTAIGAISADVTMARAAITAADSFSGQSLRVSYSKLLPATRTNIALAASQYSSRNFYTFAEAQSMRQAADAGADPDAAVRLRSQMQISINQSLPGRWGDFYVTGSVREFWHSSESTTQLQGGYNNHIRFGSLKLSYGFSAARQTDLLTGKPATRMQANFSLPLGRSPYAPMFSSSFNRSASGGKRSEEAQQVFSGTGGENHQLSYNVSASEAAGEAAFAASSQYRSTYSSMSASVSVGSGYSQQSVGATGGMVVHRGGFTLSNQMTDTFGIVEAIGAAGARVTNSTGTVINRSGYAVLPFLLPYRMNSITIDPQGAVSPDVEFKSTTAFVAPRLNAVSLVRFETVAGKAILITALRPDGSEVPFGAGVYNDAGTEVGLSGQDGRIYLRGIAEEGTLTVRWGDATDEQCRLAYRLPKEQAADDPFIRIDARCTSELEP
jgi:outer membrane usher protein